MRKPRDSAAAAAKTVLDEYRVHAVGASPFLFRTWEASCAREYPCLSGTWGLLDLCPHRLHRINLALLGAPGTLGTSTGPGLTVP